MKLIFQYVKDSKGKIKFIQLPLNDWKKLMKKLNEYEQILKIKSDLIQAFNEVEILRKFKFKKQTLKEFLPII